MQANHTAFFLHAGSFLRLSALGSRLARIAGLYSQTVLPPCFHDDFLSVPFKRARVRAPVYKKNRTSRKNRLLRLSVNVSDALIQPFSWSFYRFARSFHRSISPFHSTTFCLPSWEFFVSLIAIAAESLCTSTTWRARPSGSVLSILDAIVQGDFDIFGDVHVCSTSSVTGAAVFFRDRGADPCGRSEK